jgi:hypothetical protein
MPDDSSMNILKKSYFSLPLLIILFLVSGKGWAQDAEKEANLKAVFLYNFTKYIDWPNLNNNQNFVIGVVGTAEIINALNQIAKSYRVEGKKILILNFKKGDEISHCDLLFISGHSGIPVLSAISQTGRGTLTVSEEPPGSSSGAAFNFVIKDDKLKFEASLKAINLTGLKISAQLLKLAILVD